MSKGNTLETDILKLLFNATAIADLAQDDGSSPCTNISVALQTADPGEAGSHSTNETAYTGYARINVARTSGGWTVTNNSVSPVANIDFGECTASAGGAITHFSVGTGVSNYLMYSGTVTPNITMAVGVIPRPKTTSTITEDCWPAPRKRGLTPTARRLTATGCSAGCTTARTATRLAASCATFARSFSAGAGSTAARRM